MAGEPEHYLADIDVSSSKIDAVLRIYGPPAKHTDETDPTYPPGSGEGEHIWQVADTDLFVYTMYYTSDQDLKIETVTVATITRARQGPASGLHTGRGVSLGATQAAVKKAYGRKYLAEKIYSHPTLTYCFRDDTFLYFRLDAHGVVDQITLVISVE